LYNSPAAVLLPVAAKHTALPHQRLLLKPVPFYQGHSLLQPYPLLHTGHYEDKIAPDILTHAELVYAS
jgi:hypothetical protein